MIDDAHQIYAIIQSFPCRRIGQDKRWFFGGTPFRSYACICRNRAVFSAYLEHELRFGKMNRAASVASCARISRRAMRARFFTSNRYPASQRKKQCAQDEPGKQTKEPRKITHDRIGCRSFTSEVEVAARLFSDSFHPDIDNSCMSHIRRLEYPRLRST